MYPLADIERRKRSGVRAICMPGALALLLSACAPDQTVLFEETLGGDAKVGRELIYQYGCGSCHVIPGVAEANGQVGPPLNGVGARQYLAGSLPNTSENMHDWIMNPQRIEPGTAMPDLGVSDAQAWHIAAYLYTLSEPGAE